MRWLFALCLLFNVILSGCGADSTATKDNNFAPLSQIIISSENPFIANKTINKFTAEGNFSNLFTRDISAEVIWASSEPGIATIDSNGLATATGPGTTQITATLNGESDYFFLTVTNATLSRIEINPVAPTIPKGLSQQFEAKGTFSDASEQVMTHSVTWSSVDTEIATIDQNGLASALLEGTTNITAAFDGVTKTTQLTVAAAALTAIKVTPALSEVPQRVNVKYIASGTFSDGSINDVTSQVNWTSSDDSIATISASGIAIGSSAGTVTIKASSGAISSSAALTVTEAFLVQINLTPASPTVAVGETLQLMATGVFDNNATVNITSNVIWSSTESTVATVSNVAGTEGLVTGGSIGSTTVNVTSGAITGSLPVTVN